MIKDYKVPRQMRHERRDHRVARLGWLPAQADGAAVAVRSGLGKRPSETVALLVEEALRMSEHPQIDFRDSMAGRQAYVKGSGLAVWEVAMVARDYGGDVEKVAAHLQWPRTWVEAALNYAREYKEEIDAALADNDAIDFAALQRLLPQVEQISVDDNASSGKKA